MLVKAKGGGQMVESNMLPTPGRSLVGTRSVYLLANSELLSNTVDEGKMGVGPMLDTKKARRPGSRDRSTCWLAPSLAHPRQSQSLSGTRPIPAILPASDPTPASYNSL